MPEWLRTIAIAVGAIAAYEVVRLVVIERIRRRLRNGAIQFVRRHHVKLESARFIDRLWLRERLAWDAVIEAAVLDATRRTGLSIPELRERVDTYVEEIAPYFSIAMYYRLGATVAKGFVNFCYELVCDSAGFDRQLAKAPPGAIRVYVFNHRSNFDPVVVAFGLVRQVAMSYAVGEWALVWPLSAIFRSFGSYFVRRGEADPLYHAVLERFVQLLAGHGAVTGFFPEGGLTRDGALRRPRSGLLDYLIKLRREFPERDLIFLPVGLNYDRVLEDRWLVRERDGRPRRPTFVVRVANLAALVVWVPWLIAANLLRVATRSHRKFGYAALEFGEPLLLSEWPGGAELHTLDDAARKPAVDALATELLYHRVGRAVPVTPVAASCVALLRAGALDDSAVVARVRDVLKEARAHGAPIAFGRAFDDVRQRRAAPEEDVSGMGGTDAQLLDLEEAERVWALSLPLLARRGVVRRTRGVIAVREPELVAYYALSIVHHLDAAWPAARDARKEAGEAGRPPAPWGEGVEKTPHPGRRAQGAPVTR